MAGSFLMIQPLRGPSGRRDPPNRQDIKRRVRDGIADVFGGQNPIAHCVFGFCFCERASGKMAVKAY